MNSRRPLLFWFFSCLLVCLSAAKAAATPDRIIYPASQAMVTRPEIVVIGTAQQADILLSLEGAAGRQEYPLTPQNLYFSQPVQLQPGRNLLALRDGSGKTLSEPVAVFFDQGGDPAAVPEAFRPYHLHSRNNLITACTTCHYTGADGRIKSERAAIKKQSSCVTAECHPKRKAGRFTHGPVKDDECLQCHNPHGSFHPNFLKTIRGELCFSCHTDSDAMLVDSPVAHFPVKKGECISCHDPHSSEQEFHLKEKTLADLCARCHQNRVSSHPHMHDPVQKGDCNACHSPHVSEHEGLLVGPAAELCVNCHGERKEEFAAKYVHEPVTKGCGLCHDPHGSATENHLRTPKDQEGRYLTHAQPLVESCLACHASRHPEITAQIRSAPVKHKPITEGKCLACHTPHSTNFQKQLKTPLSESCFACHQKMEKLLTTSRYKHGPVRTNDCAQCHLVHGAQNQFLLRANFSTDYYGRFELQKYELCFLCHNSKVVLEERGSETGFRNGSLNLHFIHVNKQEKGRNCITCHDIHASNQEKHIRNAIPFQGRFTLTLEFTKTDTGGGCLSGCHQPRQYDREKPVAH